MVFFFFLPLSHWGKRSIDWIKEERNAETRKNQNIRIRVLCLIVYNKFNCNVMIWCFSYHDFDHNDSCSKILDTLAQLNTACYWIIMHASSIISGPYQLLHSSFHDTVYLIELTRCERSIKFLQSPREETNTHSLSSHSGTNRTTGDTEKDRTGDLKTMICLLYPTHQPFWNLVVEKRTNVTVIHGIFFPLCFYHCSSSGGGLKCKWTLLSIHLPISCSTV